VATSAATPPPRRAAAGRPEIIGLRT
jgi:hypothetical protein